MSRQIGRWKGCNNSLEKTFGFSIFVWRFKGLTYVIPWGVIWLPIFFAHLCTPCTIQWNAHQNAHWNIAIKSELCMISAIKPQLNFKFGNVKNVGYLVVSSRWARNASTGWFRDVFNFRSMNQEWTCEFPPKPPNSPKFPHYFLHHQKCTPKRTSYLIHNTCVNYTSLVRFTQIKLIWAICWMVCEFLLLL